jgi:hypothetical protein
VLQPIYFGDQKQFKAQDDGRGRPPSVGTDPPHGIADIVRNQKRRTEAHQARVQRAEWTRDRVLKGPELEPDARYWGDRKLAARSVYQVASRKIANHGILLAVDRVKVANTKILSLWFLDFGFSVVKSTTSGFANSPPVTPTLNDCLRIMATVIDSNLNSYEKT